MTDQPARILRFAEVSRRTGLGRTSIYEGIREGTFPAPVKLTKTAVGWRSTDIDAWIASLQSVGVSAGVSRESDAA
jgi:prophage regulatory protein